MKTFSKFEIARLKRTAQNINQYLNKAAKLKEKIAKLQAELDEVNQLIEVTDAPTKLMTGGYGTQDIFDRVLNDNGTTRLWGFEFKYPFTIIPPVDDVIKARAYGNLIPGQNAKTTEDQSEETPSEPEDMTEEEIVEELKGIEE